jgi:hypothetical protein
MSEQPGAARTVPLLLFYVESRALADRGVK